MHNVTDQESNESLTMKDQLSEIRAGRKLYDQLSLYKFFDLEDIGPATLTFQRVTGAPWDLQTFPRCGKSRNRLVAHRCGVARGDHEAISPWRYVQLCFSSCAKT